MLLYNVICVYILWFNFFCLYINFILKIYYLCVLIQYKIFRNIGNYIYIIFIVELVNYGLCMVCIGDYKCIVVYVVFYVVVSSNVRIIVCFVFELY